MSITATDSVAGSLAAAQLRSGEIEQEITRNPRAFRILTGDRPTGYLHLGHYFGTLHNRVRLQDAGAEVFVIIADYQAITDRDSTERLGEYATGAVLDYLATGIDPAKSVIFAHSAVPALNQLTYPVHQAADILFCRANLVPAGQDQLPHVELTKRIARRFNERYGPVFGEPDALLSDAPLLLGTDGQKMSKSRGNAIELRASADETARLIRGAKTDNDRHITYDPARRPDVSSLVLLTALCLERDPVSVAEQIGSGGAAALKRAATEAVNERFAPLRARRAELAADPGYVRQVLLDGCSRAQTAGDRTLGAVRAAMSMNY
jgi:tryptophanyl-tRNA synthetase